MSAWKIGRAGSPVHPLRAVKVRTEAAFKALNPVVFEDVGSRRQAVGTARTELYGLIAMGGCNLVRMSRQRTAWDPGHLQPFSTCLLILDRDHRDQNRVAAPPRDSYARTARLERWYTGRSSTSIP